MHTILQLNNNTYLLDMNMKYNIKDFNNSLLLILFHISIQEVHTPSYFIHAQWPFKTCINTF